MIRIVAIAVILYLSCRSICDGKLATELLKNPDLEVTTFTGNWVCNGGCTLESSREHYSGYHSMKVSNRHHFWEGPGQDVQLNSNVHYSFVGYVKLLSMAPGHNYHATEAILTCQDSHGRRHSLKFGRSPGILQGIWTEIGGTIKLPLGYHACNVHVQVDNAAVNFLVDHLSLRMLANDPQWKTRANERIENIRKANVTFRFIGGSQLSQGLEVELIQLSHEFAFGSAVGATQMVDPAFKKYQDVFYDNFEWAVLENALKWQQMERHRGTINYSRPVTALRALREKGIKVRGHNVFWAVDRHAPSWIQSLNKNDLLQAMTDRVNGVVGHTKGLVKHWDVNNENLHGDFYERHTGNPNITMQMFRDIHHVDQNVKLFLNEFGIVEGGNGNVATALKSQAKRFTEANVPIYGIGIQSHIKNAHLDITSIKAKLDKVAEAGLPIWITELSVAESDATVKASALEDIYTLYFSHPSVEGILLWGFWDGRLFDPNARLFEGQNLTANAAGRAYQNLFKKTWRTHETRHIVNHTPISVRAFKGNYSVNIKANGRVIESENFTLDKSGTTLEIHLQGHGTHSANIIIG